MGSAKLKRSVVACKFMAIAAGGVCVHDSVGSFPLNSSSMPLSCSICCLLHGCGICWPSEESWGPDWTGFGIDKGEDQGTNPLPVVTTEADNIKAQPPLLQQGAS